MQERNKKGQFVNGSSSPVFKNEINNRYGRLTVVGLSDKKKKRRATWICKCDCGNEIEVNGTSLRMGNTRSCGCLFLDKIKDRKLDKNPHWKGKDCNNHAKHSWIVDNFIKPDYCELCHKQVETKSFDWSNKDHRYSRKREDWQYVCRKCHVNYDIKNNNLLGKK